MRSRQLASFTSRAAWLVAFACCVTLFGGLSSAPAAVINVGAGTISGLGAGSGTVTFNGISGGIAEFVINGDLNVNAADTVSVTNNGSNAGIRLIVGNDVNLGAGAVFDFAAAGSSGGAGGGSGTSGGGG